MARKFGNGILLGDTSTSCAIYEGSGSPEGVVTANPGSVYLDKNGGIWEKGRGTGNTGWYQTDNFGGSLNSTNWYMIPHWSVSTAAQVNNQVIYVPWYLSWPVTIDAVGFEVTAAAAASGTPVIRVGVFAMASDGTPGTLLKDCGTVGVTTTGAKATATGQACQCQPGWVFIALGAQGGTGTQATLRSIGNGPHLPAMNTLSGTIGASASAQTSFISSGISGAFASSPTVTFGGTAFPRVQIKPASVP